VKWKVTNERANHAVFLRTVTCRNTSRRYRSRLAIWRTASTRLVLHLVWSGVYLLLLCFLGPYIAKSAPLLTAAPEPPALQHWHTTYVPTDSGVYPMEVFAPALPPLFAQPQIVEIGDPPEPPVHVPEPESRTLIEVSLALAALWGFMRWQRTQQMNIKLLQSQLVAANARVAKFYYALVQIESIGGYGSSVAIARKALEEK